MIDAFGNASTLNLGQLRIEGVVLLKDAVLKGTVEVINNSGLAVDLNAAITRSLIATNPMGNIITILPDNRIVLENVRIVINSDGTLTISAI